MIHMTHQLKVLYKNDELLVVDKKFDLKINSNQPEDKETLDKLLAHQFPECVDHTVQFGFRFAHRLDYATSGVQFIALNKKMAAVFQKLFTKRRITKHYLALVRGHVEHQHLLIDVPIGPDSSYTDIHRMCVSSCPHCSQPVKPCSTVAVLLETGHYSGAPASKLLLIPFTGRTHQLRVHCSHINHCIIGDYMYSNRLDTEPPRMMLHSYRMHVPLTPQPLDITAPDYFLSETDPAWQPTQIYTTYQQFCDSFYFQEEGIMQLKIQDLKAKNVTLEEIK